ncbi:putative regulatory protein, FmdB family [Actinobaculum suis]|uniref:Putative regulatory protein, FmdB family n=1 Tax=Actinobaculum suis TaxID=1657 RepID=A0A7Z9C8Y5_9ACTO|nr:FmdB family zinc ribbon protein [Actinobaculum suis]VDG77040.1 putative regulatory protein, FmdB family [Actinobaculum suis]
MPTYSYRCAHCGHEFDTHQSMHDAPLTECPSCGLPQLHKILGRGQSIIFKGSGFYHNDSRSASSSSASSNSASAS